MANKQSALSVQKILKMKASGEKIAMATAYDYPTARLEDAAGIDMILVGDSLGTVVQGRPTTLGARLEDMIYHAEMVQRAATRALVVVDTPFPYCQLGPEEAVRACAKIIKETNATAVKIEGGVKRAETVRAVVDAGIPVVGHCGLVPQSVKASGYKVQRDVDRLLEDVKAIEAAGAFAIVLECVQRDYAAEATRALTVPTIGIGSGAECDGQVLVFHDIFNFTDHDPEGVPKHARVYRDLRRTIDEGLREYIADVKSLQFPGDAESFGAKRSN